MVKLIVDLIDMGDIALAGQIELALQGLQTTIVKVYPMCNSLESFVNLVIHSVPIRGTLGVLRMWGHGFTDEGSQFIGVVPGQSGIAFNNRSILTKDTVKYVPVTLLAPYFSANARVELRACKAATNQGKEMMLELARHLGVRVHASEEGEIGPYWMSRVWEATPDGKFEKIRGVQINERN